MRGTEGKGNRGTSEEGEGERGEEWGRGEGGGGRELPEMSRDGNLCRAADLAILSLSLPMQLCMCLFAGSRCFSCCYLTAGGDGTHKGAMQTFDAMMESWMKTCPDKFGLPEE